MTAMEDLDSLLEDLGRGKSSSFAKKQRPPSSRVDLNELEDLMQDLAAPTANKVPEPTPASRPNTDTKAADLSSNPPALKMIQPQQATVSSFSNNGTGSTRSSTSVDDLDALMESLNASSKSTSAARRQSSKPPSTYDAPKAFTPVVQQPSQPPPQTSNNGTIKGDDLDSLLTNLTTQMDKIDSSNPAARGQCFTCKQSILGEMIQAIGRCYHPEHFSCSNCRELLGTRNFFEQNNQPYCERCFQEIHCARCGHCSKPVLDRCISALGKKWHVEHFICTQCLKPFGGGVFFEKDGRPYCETDFFGLYAPKCAACKEPIRADCINALGSQWHPEHFVCSYCQKSFANGSFFEYQGKPYCETHYHQQTGSLCAGCGKPITGRCVNALEKKWHPEHFVCAFCMNPLAGGSFTEHNSKAYCRDCHGKLFGN